MTDAQSNGYDSIVEEYAMARSDIGAGLVHRWVEKNVQPGGAVLDVGCGTGIPITARLIDAGFAVFATDASRRMVEAFRARFPETPVACETAEHGHMFERRFDCILAIGLIFLFEAQSQRNVLGRFCGALQPGGQLLFSAPLETGEWNDVLTGGRSTSLGETGYIDALKTAGLEHVACHSDSGGNNYYHACLPAH